MLTQAVLKQNLIIDGIDLSANQLSRPEGKSFVALLPVLAISTQDLDRKTDKALAQVAHNRVTQRFGSPEQFYDSSFLRSVIEIRDVYNTYADGVNGIPSPDETRQNVDDALDQYCARLRSNRMTPDSVPWYKQKAVAEEVRGRNVPVPQNWKLNDRRTFERCLADRIENEANARYNGKIAECLGSGVTMPRDLDWNSFTRHPAIQRKWRSGLGLDKDVVLYPSLGLADYTALAYPPRVNSEIRNVTAAFQTESATFAPGGKNEEAGKNAVRKLLVPPIALCFSLFVAFVHILKFSSYCLRFVSTWSLANKLVVLSLLIYYAIFTGAKTNSITDSRTFHYFENRVDCAVSAIRLPVQRVHPRECASRSRLCVSAV